MPAEQAVPMIEAFGVSDIFVSGLGEVEDLGGNCYRFVFYSKQHVGGRDEMVVVAKLVAPLEVVPPALIMAAKAIGFTFINVKPRGDLLN